MYMARPFLSKCLKSSERVNIARMIYKIQEEVTGYTLPSTNTLIPLGVTHELLGKYS